MQVNENTVKIL